MKEAEDRQSSGSASVEREKRIAGFGRGVIVGKLCSQDGGEFGEASHDTDVGALHECEHGVKGGVALAEFIVGHVAAPGGELQEADVGVSDDGGKDVPFSDRPVGG